MALRLRRDVQKASYYVWFLGAEEAKGLRGARVINSVLPYLVDRSRGQEPLKVTLQVSHKGIKIVQGSSKHLIPHSAITSSVQTDDIVACVLLLYNPATKCPLHVHAYRCDSETTAEALHLQLQVLINRPDNQKRFEELETRLGILPPLPTAKAHESTHKSSATSHHQSQQQQQQPTSAYPHQAPAQRRQETSPKRFSSSLGSDTGNSTRESECSEEHVGGVGNGTGVGVASSPISRSPPHGSKHRETPHRETHSAHPPHYPPQLTAQQNSDLFDSLAAELRAKLNGNGPPLLLPPRDYDTVHRSKGNLTAIELRRCRNALIVGGAVPPKNAAAGAATTASATANGKQVSSRGSSGIGSDLAPSPERQELHSSSEDEHWSNEADNSVIALKPSQIAMERSGPIIPHHPQLSRKSAMQPPEDSYLRDLPAKPYAPRQSQSQSQLERERERERKRAKTPASTKSSSWSREDDPIKPIIMRPADYDAKFNRVMQLSSVREPAAPPKLRDTDKYNEINRLLNKKLSAHDREKDRERDRERERDSPELYKPERHASRGGSSSSGKPPPPRLELDDELDDSDPTSDQPPSGYRKENLTDKQKFLEYNSKKHQQQLVKSSSYAAEEAQRYGGSRHRYVDPAELPFEQPMPSGHGHNKYAAVHRSELEQRNTERQQQRSRELDEPRRHSRERERERERDRDHYSRSKERNPYREAESLPYIQSMEKMIKSSALRYAGDVPVRSSSGRHNQAVASQVSPRDRFHDAKDKFRAMERSGSRYDLVASDERDSQMGGDATGDYRGSSHRRRGGAGSVERAANYEREWSDEERERERERPPVMSRSRTRSRDMWEQEDEQQQQQEQSSMRHGQERRGNFKRQPERQMEARREHSRDGYRHESVVAVAATASSGYSQREREREREREQERERERERESHSRHQSGRVHSRQDYLSEPAPLSGRHLDKVAAHMYPAPTPTPSSSSGGGGNGGGGSSASGKQQLANMPKGYRHSYAEPVFARSGGRVGLAAVNPY